MEIIIFDDSLRYLLPLGVGGTVNTAQEEEYRLNQQINYNAVLEQPQLHRVCKNFNMEGKEMSMDKRINFWN